MTKFRQNQEKPKTNSRRQNVTKMVGKISFVYKYSQGNKLKTFSELEDLEWCKKKITKLKFPFIK